MLEFMLPFLHSYPWISFPLLSAGPCKSPRHTAFGCSKCSFIHWWRTLTSLTAPLNSHMWDHSRIDRFPTCVARRVSQFTFHRVLCRKSKYSCAESVQPPRVLHHTMWARIQSTTLWRWGGQSLNCGRMVRSLGIQTGSIRNIQAMRFLVLSQIFRPSLTHDRSRRAAVDLRLRPRGCWDRRLCFDCQY